MSRGRSWAVALLVVSAGPAYAHQPVMDMAPRWKDGWGAEVRHERHQSDTLKDGDADIDNPLGRQHRINVTWLEFVRTFEPEVRVTAKLPVVDQSRVIERNGVPVRQSGHGVGDLILGVPLKKLFNEHGVAGNIGLTPSLRVPTGSTDDSFPAGDGSWDPGLSLSYQRDTSFFYQFYDVWYWANTRGRKGIAEGDELGLDINWGILPYHDNATRTGLWLMWDISARHSQRGLDASGDIGGTRLSTGPMLMLYRRNITWHLGVKVPAYERVRGQQVSYGTELEAGVGIAF